MKTNAQTAVGTNLAVVANAVELISQVVGEVAGNVISNQIEGETATPAIIQDIAAARLQSLLTAKIGAN